jgi:hypothetical protein
MDPDKKSTEAAKILIDNSPIEDFEGFSSSEMRYLIITPFSKDSPFQINKKIPNSILDQIPIFNQIEFLLNKINEVSELKLTATGSLPTTLIKEIYNMGLIKDEDIENGITKLYAETSSQPIQLTRLITEMAGFTKKRFNRLSLTKTWKDRLLKNNRQEIFEQTFSTFTYKFTWGYFDGYESQAAGQVGFPFSLFLLSKYGADERLDSFYSEKYLRAFPGLIDQFYDNLNWARDAHKSFNSCYSIRTFDRFLKYFNLITIRTEGRLYHDSKKFIKKTAIFDDIMTFDN